MTLCCFFTSLQCSLLLFQFVIAGSLGIESAKMPTYSKVSVSIIGGRQYSPTHEALVRKVENVSKIKSVLCFLRQTFCCWFPLQGCSACVGNAMSLQFWLPQYVVHAGASLDSWFKKYLVV